MQPFRRAYLDPAQLKSIANELRAQGAEQAVIDELFREAAGDTVWFNDTYQVNVRRFDCVWGDVVPMVHLSIKRCDKESIHDWRELQEIKNLIVGPEFEAVELYPAEARLVDTANQYHLWVLEVEGMRFPFGFNVRVTEDTLPYKISGGKQRPRNS